MDYLEVIDIPCVIYDGANTESTDKIVEAGFEVCKENACDFIIALSGSSIIPVSAVVAPTFTMTVLPGVTAAPV